MIYVGHEKWGLAPGNHGKLLDMGNQKSLIKKYKFGLLVVFILGFGFLALTWGNSFSICFGTPFPSFENVAKSAVFELPPSVNDIEYDVDARSRGCTIYVKLRMNSLEIALFRASTLVSGFEYNQLDEDRILYFLKRKGWTLPEESLAGYGYSGDYPYTSQWIFVESLKNDKLIVSIITNKEWL